MISRDKLKKIQSEYDSATLSYNTSKYILIAAAFGCVMSFMFPRGEAVMFVFVAIGFALYFFHCKEKLKKTEREIDYACQELFGKKYKESTSDFMNYLYK